MMVDPDTYIEEKQNWDLVDLYKEKQYLEKYIKDYKSGKLNNDGTVATSPAPDVIASVYEDYLVKLNILIANKERDKRPEKKYIEITNDDEIDNFLEKHHYFCECELLKIIYKNNSVNFAVEDGNVEYEFYIDDVENFTMTYYTDENWIDEINIRNENGMYFIDIDGASVYMTAKKVKIKTLDTENMIYTYVSVKYKEEQDRTFYYLSNIDDLKIGDYVWVPARDISCPAIVENIEKFKLDEVPFPVYRTKTIIRKSSKDEFEEYHKEKTNIFKENDNEIYNDGEIFDFEDEDTIFERIKELPFIKSQYTQWRKSEQNEDGSFTMPFPIYSEEVREWIEMFYKLKLIDKNYIDNYDEYIKDKNIEDLSAYEILSYFTHFIRGERFCDGMIASALESGVIEKLEKILFSRLAKFKEVDDENIDEIKENNIMFLTLAECGAMGEPNAIEVITKIDNKIRLYHSSTNYFVVPKIYETFSMLKNLKCGLFGAVTGVPEGFVHIDTGMGNHLFVNKAISEAFQQRIKDYRPEEIYTRWLAIGLDIIGYDWKNFDK